MWIGTLVDQLVFHILSSHCGPDPGPCFPLHLLFALSAVLLLCHGIILASIAVLGHNYKHSTVTSVVNAVIAPMGSGTHRNTVTVPLSCRLLP